MLTVTHNSAIADMVDRAPRVSDGGIIHDERRTDPKTAEDLHW